MKRRILIILFWSVIAAAFIGPGTLVTASTAGAGYGIDLVWTLVFATIACIIFQEMAARLTIVTGNDLATTLSFLKPRWLVGVVPFGVLLGCVAYEAGNLLGAAIGISSLTGIPMPMAQLLCGLVAFLLIVLTSVKTLVRILGGLVAVMGLFFIFIAFQGDISFSSLWTAAVKPNIPIGSEWIILGLIGTTVVPYNLFLGSGLGDGSTLKDMKFGLIISVILGGMISVAVLLVGTMFVNEEASLHGLIDVVDQRLGGISSALIAAGVFAAGITSAITAPLAAGYVSYHFFERSDRGSIKKIAAAVTFIGTLWGFLDFRPEGIILAAQAFNGLALPFAAAFLWGVTNDRMKLGNQITGNLTNVLAFLIMNVLIVLGVKSIYSVIQPIAGLPESGSPAIFMLFSLPVTSALVLWIWRIRKM